MKKLIVSLLLSVCGTVLANEYPTKPIQIVVPMPPGGAFEISFRTMFDRLQKQTGWNFVIVNRPGASQVVAANIVAKAPPDGYTLFAGEIEIATSAPLVYTKLPFEPNDLIPVSGLVRNNALLVLAPVSFPPNNLKELVEYARANPGKVTFGTNGAGLPFHIAMEAFAAKHNIKLTHVPFKGLPPGITAVMGGEISLMFAGEVQGLNLIKTGRVKAITISGAERIADLPGVMTSTEQGEPELYWGNRTIMLAPAGTPADIVNKIQAEIEKLQRNPDYVKTDLKTFNFSPYIRNPSAMAKDIDTVKARNKKILDSINFEASTSPN